MASLSLSIDTIFSSSQNRFSHQKTHTFSPIKSLQSPQRPNQNSQFLDPISIHRLQTLNSFTFTRNLHHGSLQIRPMEPDEVEPAVGLLAESFAESIWTPGGYVKLMEFLVKQYVVERRNLVPHSVMLVGFYREGEDEGGDFELACIAEVSFDARGAIGAPPTPLPPKNCPYICNMTVRKRFRRRGIGRQLLNACEELISQMKTIRKVYLHCRMIDTVPFQMYTKAGYSNVQIDSILVWFSFQRRKYLMLKQLPPLVDSLSDSNPGAEWKIVNGIE